MGGTLRGVFGRCLDAETTIPPELETRIWPLLLPLQGGWVCSAWDWGWGGGKDASFSQRGRKSRLITEMRAHQSRWWRTKGEKEFPGRGVLMVSPARRSGKAGYRGQAEGGLGRRSGKGRAGWEPRCLCRLLVTRGTGAPLGTRGSASHGVSAGAGWANSSGAGGHVMWGCGAREWEAQPSDPATVSWLPWALPP